ncbi:MAG: membrane protein insertase YidC [Opitutaceae bacterium]
MDKKNTLLGIIFIAAAFGYMFWEGQQLEKQRQQELLNAPAAIEEPQSTAVEGAAMSAGNASAGDAPTSADQMLDALVQKPAEAAVELPTVPAEEETVVLSNDYIEVEFTTKGGAIRTVSFLQTKRSERDDYVFNEDGYLPALSLSLDVNGEISEFALDYSIESQTSDSITFVYRRDNGIEIRRMYRLSRDGDELDPYVITHSTTFNNAPSGLSTVYFNLGTSRSISKNPLPTYLNVGYYDGEDSEFIAINKLTGGKGFLGIGASDPRDEIQERARIEWSSVKNQFFAGVLSSETPGQDLHIYPVEAPMVAGEVSPAGPGITGSVGYSLAGTGQSETLNFEYFVGPKEFKRLQGMGNHQDEVMQFGFLAFISKLLLSFMYAIHSFVPSWGWSIVIMTICIKTLFWPLTAKASRSQKRMAKIQGPMAEMKEKYKDDPKRIQQETMKLFKEHQVNPVAGCLPMLIQMPIFLGLFYMLRTASELRHESFLWVSDLSQPDTLMEVAGFPINILPLIMGLTMFLQMSMMPVNPSADPAQQKIFKFLPFIFLVFLYNFSSGLVLYWTVQNILTIIQQKIINSQPDEPLKPVAAVADPSGPKGKGGSPRTKSRKK